MSIVNPLILNANVLGLLKEWSPADIEMSAINLTVQQTTVSKIINCAGHKHFQVLLKQVITGTTPTLGTGTLKVRAFFEDGSTQLWADTDLVTALDFIAAAGTYYTSISWSRDISGSNLVKADTAVNGTTAANIDFFRPVSYFRLILDVSAVNNNVTTSLMDIYFRAHT